MTPTSDDDPAFASADLLALDFDQYQRYRKSAELITQLAAGRRDLRVLEVGSNVLNLLPEFLPGSLARIVRCDTSANQAGDPDYRQIVAGEPLPFGDAEFDFVVTIDVLEHVPPAGRAQFLAECVRVAGVASIVSFPRRGADVEAAERVMSAVHKAILGTDHAFLVEHAQFGLPEREEVEGILATLGVDFRVFDNSPLKAWLHNCTLTTLLATYGPEISLRTFNTEYNSNYYGAFADSPGYRLVYAIAAATTLAGMEQPTLPAPAVEVESVTASWIGAGQIMHRFLASLAESHDTAERFRDTAERFRERAAETFARAEMLEEAFAAAEKRERAAKKTNGAELGALRSALAHEVDRRIVAEAQLQAMRRSLTWRAIAPLRKAMALAARARCWMWRSMAGGARKAAQRWPGMAASFTRRMPRLAHRLVAASGAVPADVYRTWREQHMPASAELAAMAASVEEWPSQPLISILTPVYNVDERWLRACIDSVRRQAYPRWELCLADDASSAAHVREVLHEYARADPRIKICLREENGGISAATNSALEIATGDFVALLDNDDELAPHALMEVARALAEDSEIDFVYTDEDKIDERGTHTSAMFKPDWSPEHLLSTHYPCHMAVYRRSLVQTVGGFRSEFDGSQDYDLCLRVSEHCRRVHHIPKVLYHWRTIPGSAAADQQAKPEAHDAARRALQDALHRRGLGGVAEPSPLLGLWRARPAIEGSPLVSIVIPTAGRMGVVRGQQVDLLLHCIRSVTEQSTWPNLEFVVVHNGDLRPEQLEALGQLSAPIRLVEFDRPFNLSEKMNLGVGHAAGEFCVLLNDDIELIEPSWIEALLEWAQLPDIGAVGATLLYEDGRLQHAGVILLEGVPHHSYIGFSAQTIGDNGILYCTRNAIAVTGACVMVKRADYIAVGGFDPGLPLNYNDVDMCLKLRALGRRIVMTPYAKLYHFEGVSKSHGGLDVELACFLERHPDYAAGVRRDPYYNPCFDQRLPFYELPGVRNHDGIGAAIAPRGGPGSVVESYSTWIQHRVLERRATHSSRVIEGFVSLITPAYNTPADFLHKLARTVFGQTYHKFEWVIADNGSTDQGTIEALREISRDPRVRLVRLEENMQIHGGLRAAFEAATGRYVLPLDSDDLLYPDAIAVVVAAIEEHGYPPLLYSDEDKIDAAEVPRSPFFKPDWDPILFLNCCYIAHLCAIDRELGHQLGLYTEPNASGCTDLDTFTRFLDGGYTPVHIPEVLYSWRIHSGSTAAFQPGVKPYTIVHQEFVLARHLSNHPRGAEFEIVPNEILPPSTTWRLRRKDRVASPVIVAVVNPAAVPLAAAEALWQERGAVQVRSVATIDELSAVAGEAIAAGLRLVVAGVEIESISSDWLVETETLMAFFPQVAAASGRAFDGNDRVAYGAGAMGFDAGVGYPDRGAKRTEPGYYGLLLQQRRVGAISFAAAMLAPEFLLVVLPSLTSAAGAVLDRGQLEVAFAAHAAREGRLLALTPFAEIEVGEASTTPIVPLPPSDLVDAAAEPAYAHHHGRHPSTAFSLVWRRGSTRSIAN